MNLKLLAVFIALVVVLHAACPGPNRPNGSQCKRNGQCASGFCRNRSHLKCSNGECEAKRARGVTAYRSRKASCISNVVRCGICGKSGRSNGEKCSADSHCASGFCKGRGSCAGRCQAKRASGESCWENALGCIDRGCLSGVASCGLCHNNDLGLNDACMWDNQCAAGKFCKGKGSCAGRCKNILSDGATCHKRSSGTCITRGCASNSVRCERCGDSNLPVDAKCINDSDCESGFCKGRGSCNGRCKAKKSVLEPCWMRAGSCIDRGCKSSLGGRCGVCGSFNVKRPNGLSCNSNSNCESNYCSNKDGITCAGTCKSCPIECGSVGCHERNGVEVCGDKDLKTWFNYLAEDAKDTFGSLGQCFNVDYGFAECIVDIVGSAANCLKDATECKISLCPNGGDCKCFAFEKTFESGDSSTFTSDQQKFIPTSTEIDMTTTNEMTVAGVVTGGLTLTPNPGLEVIIMQDGDLPLIQLASTAHIVALSEYEFAPEAWDNRRIPLSDPHIIAKKVIMAGVIPVIVQVLVTPVVFVTIDGTIQGENELTIAVNGELKLHSPLTAEYVFGQDNFDTTGFNAENFDATELGAEIAYKVNVEAELNLRLNFGAEFTLMVQGVSATIAPTFELKAFLKGELAKTPQGGNPVYIPAEAFYRLKDKQGKHANCGSLVSAGVQLGVAEPAPFMSFNAASSLEVQAEYTESTSSCVELVAAAKAACTTVTAEGGCGAMGTVCEKSADVLDVVTPSLEICIPSVDLFRVNFPDLITPSFTSPSWSFKKQYCIESDEVQYLEGSVVIDEEGKIEWKRGFQDLN